MSTDPYYRWYYFAREALDEILHDPYIPPKVRRRLVKILLVEVDGKELTTFKYPYGADPRTTYRGKDILRAEVSPRQITIGEE